jgi:hypothetical protein
MPGYSAVNIPPFPRQARGCEIVLGKRLREEGGLQNEARGVEHKPTSHAGL